MFTLLSIPKLYEKTEKTEQEKAHYFEEYLRQKKWLFFLFTIYIYKSSNTKKLKKKKTAHRNCIKAQYILKSKLNRKNLPIKLHVPT